jgi:protein gp37
MNFAARLHDKPGSHYHGTTRHVNGNAVWTGKVVLAPTHIVELPLSWKKPQRIFVNSTGDLFHEDAPMEWIDRAFAVMKACPQHVFQVLTKRPGRMRVYAETSAVPDHVWLGASAEDQRRYDERWPILKGVRAKVRFFSFEPLLGPIEPDWLPEWAICGGESGRRFRPMDPDWARRLLNVCAERRTPFFMKQMAGKLPIPDDLVMREFPAGRVMSAITRQDLGPE